jgi:hypothetical protein
MSYERLAFTNANNIYLNFELATAHTLLVHDSIGHDGP